MYAIVNIKYNALYLKFNGMNFQRNGIINNIAEEHLNLYNAPLSITSDAHGVRKERCIQRKAAVNKSFESLLELMNR